MLIVQVVLPIPLENQYDYLVPTEMLEETEQNSSRKIAPIIGGRVLVPFGLKSKKMVGVVAALKDHSDFERSKIKKILKIIDTEPLWNDNLFELLKWASRYYHYPLGEVLSAAMPKKLREGHDLVIKMPEIWQLTLLGQQQNIDLVSQKTPKQGLLLKSLKEAQQLTFQQLKALTFSRTILKILLEKGWIELSALESPIQDPLKEAKSKKASWLNHHLFKEDGLVLNSEQSIAVSTINNQNGFNCFLIDGITGSGKTEVYLNAIANILKQNKQVLILVPEIGLTHQTILRFQKRFSVPLVVIHSGLNDQQRFESWLAIRNNDAAILVGTRSSLFTPFFNLGMIIVDEEHDNAYKQQDTFRYHARDLAVTYAHRLKIPVLLGSATPSIETLYNAKHGRYYHLKLTRRAGNATIAKHRLLDIRGLHLEAGLSGPLLVEMRKHLEQGNQVMLFLNRRGFAPTLICHECGWVATCSRCEQSYTVHQKKKQLRCHHCDSSVSLPEQCANPECGSTQLITLGVGTEQLETALQSLFPEYKTIRIDRDSTRRKGSLENYLEGIQNKEYHILIGTQMLAKGHHFPNVTLVGLLNVDSSLFSSDFRASEKLAQLYIQIAGRSGRASQPGEVILQTHHPEHPLLYTLLKSGYSYFSEQILLEREATGLPPYGVMALLRMQANRSELVEQILNEIATWLNSEQTKRREKSDSEQSDSFLFGPVVAPLAKRSGQFRWLLALHASDRKTLHQLIFQLKYGLKQHPLIARVRYSLDIDPCELL